MKEIPREKKLEVARYYVLGYTYKGIEDKTGVSHGSIVNIVDGLETGNLDIAGSPCDQINDLRQLASDLQKKGLSPSQALLGFLFLERLLKLGIRPEHLDQWAELVNRLANANFQVEDFCGAAFRLQELERNEGKSFEMLVEECRTTKEDFDRLTADIDSLIAKKARLSEEVGTVSAQLEELKKNKRSSEEETQLLTTKAKELRLRLTESEKE